MLCHPVLYLLSYFFLPTRGSNLHDVVYFAGAVKVLSVSGMEAHGYRTRAYTQLSSRALHLQYRSNTVCFCTWTHTALSITPPEAKGELIILCRLLFLYLQLTL